MNKKWKIMAVLALIMISALTFNAAAQDYAIPAPVSNTNRATGANFATDVDNFLHFHNYGDVAFDKYFAYGGFRAYSGGSTGFNAYELNAGYARRFGGLYLGLFYAGQITEANPAAISTTTTEITDNTYTGGFFQKDNDRTVVTNTVTAPKFYNNLGALVGVAGMGIKVGFYETLWGTDKYGSTTPPTPTTVSDITNDVDGTKTVTTDITEYNRLYGWIVPYLGWGMKLSLGGLTIKPKADVDLAFFVDEEKYSSATNNTTVNGNPIGLQTTGSNYTDNGYFSLGAAVGADVDFAPVGSHSFGAGLSYAITPDIYSHKYDAASGEETVNGTVTVVNTNTSVKSATAVTDTKTSNITTTEISRLQHEIKPSFWYVNDISDAVSLGFNYEIGFTISSESAHAKQTTTTIERYVQHDGDLSQNYKYTSVGVVDTSNEDITEFGVESAIGFGVTWKVKPDRFTLNFGVNIDLPDYTSETTHRKPTEATITKETWDYDDGHNVSRVTIPTTVSATDTTVVAQNWSAVDATYSLGGTFYFTPNFLVDMYFDNVSDRADPTTGNIGGTAASLVDINCSLLFTLKY